MKINGSSEYTVTYKSMLGTDLSQSSPDSAKRRYAYLQNMYRDYAGGDTSLIESIPGFRKIASLSGRVHAIYAHRDESGEEYAVVHSGKKVYRFKTAMRDKLTSISAIAEISDNKSSAFRLGSCLYILDGVQILKIAADGVATKIKADDDSVYVPTTFYNGERIEQKNLLTDRFKEKYMIGAIESVIYGTPALIYKITDEERMLCSVVGVRSDFIGILNVPSYAKIGSKKYKVDEIADNAFLSNNAIRGVKLGVGIHRIGKYAFSGCKALTSVTASYAPVMIDDHAFKDCTALNLFYLGAEIESFGEGIFEGCTSLVDIHYASNEKEFGLIENSDSLDSFGIYGFEKNEAFTVEIPISTPLEEIISVTVGGEALSDYSIVKTGDGKSAIVFYREDARSIEGKEVVITAVCSASVKDADGQISDFISDYGYDGTGFEAICGCTVCETFDGRAFLSGNPALPGVVFFTSRESGQSSPLYFGSYNYFCDGFGIFGVSSMLSCADSLLVFKKSDDGGGSIFYHTPKETGLDFMPKIYPITNTHNGIGAIGPSFSFFDDPIFISKTGVAAIDKRTLSLERSIACRSHNINAELLRDDIGEASLAEWQGYLALGINGKIFLADSREIFTHPSGSREYEWYYLCDIGTYKNDARVYRYSSTASEGYEVYDQPESEVEFTSYSVTTDIGKIYYTIVDGIKYEIYPTEEMRGGDFHPLVTLASFDNDLLLFGTDNGDVCVFNNDKRGVAPNFILNAEDYDEEEYESYYGNRIHPYFYTFASHRMVCGVRTAPNDCSRPDLTKNTVKHSLTLKCKLSGNGRIRCEAKTNRSGYIEHAAFPNATPDFSDFSFAALALECEDSVSLPINEKEKNWIDKELAVYCEDFRSPIGIYSLSYRYTLKGRIKHT